MPKQKLSLLIAALSVSLSHSPLHADEFDTASFEPTPLPEVLTPVRLKQPRTEVPASVSVIDADTIAASGIRELPELLRLVPGMAVGARSGWDYVASYHGTNRRNSHRMQVMIDGRSIYQASLATIDWNDIPLAMEDIERIEVTRGPNTAAYGANAFLGIINIITKHPDDSPRLRAKALGGSNDARDWYASTSGAGSDHNYRVTAAGRRDAGFDEDEGGQNRRDSENMHFVNGRWLLSPSDVWSLDLQAGYKDGWKHDDAGEGDMSPPDQDVRNYFASVKSQHFLSKTNSLKWQLDHSATRNETDWRSCVDAHDLNSSFPRRTYVCGDVNNDIRAQRTDLDIQDTWLSEGPWKLVSGAHAQYQHVESETYYSGDVNRTTYQLFGNLEYHFLPQWSATIAGSQEYFGDGEHAFSPRLALLFFPSEEHTFRAVYSEAIRTPDLFESDIAWHYVARNFTFADGSPIPGLNEYDLPTFRSPERIEEERIRSREIGYYGLWLERRLEVDVRWFNDDMNDLISDGPSYGRYNPINANTVKQRGFETEIKLQATEALRLQLSAALIDSTSNSRAEEDLTPHKSGAAAMLFNFLPNWQYTSMYYYANPINKAKFSRWDNRLARQFRIATSQLTLSATVQHYFDKQPDLFRDNIYDSPNRMYLAADLSF